MTDKLMTHLLRVYVDAGASRDGRPYWQVLVSRARDMGLASAAAFDVLDGFGPAAVVHAARAIDLAPGAHVIVELSDAVAPLQAFRDTLERTDEVGLITLEAVQIVGYGGHRH